jgi:hypothetical protein
MSQLSFVQLNHDWNAEPNAPEPQVEVAGSQVRLRFFLNPFIYKAEQWEIAWLIFDDCSAWRLGKTNMDGWYFGQCRYSKVAPGWGEFYELAGEDDLRMKPADWHFLTPKGAGDRHFLFYLRDETFECIAGKWSFERSGVGITRT